ncbi:phage terminase large subunit [Phaeobacter gallaeciensis]|uniref:Phage terminase large subunit n=1 Tax=Phaeobacter gallaeciensis TaxID=60890 RepID=A0AAD0EDC9_9RHOB|nr:phage terminase large subunit [Phaeobacter gallaeciensis]AHD10012.1 Phage terminase large subunit [Phaeobacter gallaeciensis DSM 26640]ATE93276.1 Phage terminase large subunit [Phaeobacter gallaeciensis]ATE96903.1 Phage terminase large subunit [Phaeobacter gallaeciensis]ATF01940.1 Phage terminase large subunit [Phaeobacter gallaeciensis]ATF06320.1 Phage terminase large subunit [Phaeobacter gallaeciensis]
MSKLTIDTAEVFTPLLEAARYKGAHGGRGSGKSQFFGGLAVEDAVAAPGDMGEGLRMVCIREVQKSLKHSAKSLIESKLREHGLDESQGFKAYNDVIKTPKDGLIIFQGMQDHTADSIKSLEGFHRAWVEEAQTLSAFSMSLLRPTIRWEDPGRGLKSELWFGWNPRRKIDPVDQLLRGAALPTGAAVVQANWKHNPWFPSVLEAERQDCLRDTPDQYDHIWGGGYATVFSGAYFAHLLSQARADRRIGRVNADPLLSVRAYWDIGGTGAKADATSIWIVQFVGREIRVLNYYEAQGQPLATHVNWLRDNGYGGCMCVLPHDGSAQDKVHDASYEKALQDAEFETLVIPNQGKGAASKRVEAVRRLLPNCYFNAEATEAGLDALGWYHEKRDEARNIGLGPEHDWSSHAADAFGLMAIAYEEHTAPAPDVSKFYSSAGGKGFLAT